MYEGSRGGARAGARTLAESYAPTANALGPGKRTLTESLPMSTPVAIAGDAAAASPGLTTEADMVQGATTKPAAGAQAQTQAPAATSAGPAQAPTPTAAPSPDVAHDEAPKAATGAPPATPAGPPTAGPAGPTPTPPTLVITGPRELWYFDGETPANYDVSHALSANRTGGTFAWTCSANLTLAAAATAAPTVTTATASAAANDAWISLTHTDPAGAATTTRYQLTIKAPSSLGFLRNDDQTDASFAYVTFVHYSIKDQFGTVLPRSIPINEQFTAAPTADVPGMDWRRGAAGAALVSPTDWADQVQGETSSHTPTPVAPGAAGAGTLVYHWPGDWRAGSMTVGRGRMVKSVTWSKSRGHARHT